jgi:hypothetical protein
VGWGCLVVYGVMRRGVLAATVEAHRVVRRMEQTIVTPTDRFGFLSFFLVMVNDNHEPIRRGREVAIAAKLGSAWPITLLLLL